MGTERDQLDEDIGALRAGARSWANLGLARKIELLEACRTATWRSVGRWTAAAAEAKGIAGTAYEAEETLSGPWAVLSTLDHLLQTLREIAADGAPRIDPRTVHTRSGGQIAVDVFPASARERFLFNGVRAQVWMEPGVTAEGLRETLAPWYRLSGPAPRVTLVLGAGNIASIPALDVLSKLVADGSVCLLKMNPVNAYLAPVFDEAFAPLVAGGYLRVVCGDAQAGQYLCAHPGVDAIHITGSNATYAAVARANPGKTITSELGCVTPTIVVPGAWSDADVRFQAEHIATQKLHNGGFNCIGLQVLVLPAGWKRTPDLLDAIADVMREVPDRPAYYPGAAARCEALLSQYPAALRFGRSDAGYVPRTILHLDPGRPSDPLVAEEAFCTLLAVVTLPGDTPAYLDEAVAFANRRLVGTLGANLIVHPHTAREHAARLEGAVAELRYGCIGVNAWCGVGFLLAPVPWGAFPGATREMPGSGVGFVHNSRLFSRSQKSVVRAPFAPFPRSLVRGEATLLPKPPWFVTNRRQREVAQALCDIEASSSPLRLARIAVLAASG